MIVKTREIERTICVYGLKKNVWHDTSSVGKTCQYLLATVNLTNSGQLSYIQLNSTTVLNFVLSF